MTSKAWSPAGGAAPQRTPVAAATRPSDVHKTAATQRPSGNRARGAGRSSGAQVRSNTSPVVMAAARQPTPATEPATSSFGRVFHRRWIQRYWVGSARTKSSMPFVYRAVM